MFVKEFISMAEASRELNMNMKRLDEVLHGRENGGKKRFRVNGFIPVYKNLYDKEIQYSHKANRGIRLANWIQIRMLLIHMIMLTMQL